MLRIPVITGPTAVGKTDFSLQVAEDVNGEIISADSRQVFRELSIGTAKPRGRELSRVPHHFVNERSLEQPFSAGIFAREANERIRQILNRGRIPIVVGGSTLYIYALQKGLSGIPDIPPYVRKELQHRLLSAGIKVLLEELHQVDPTTARRLDPTRSQHIVRALEVYHHTGTPLSEFHKEKEKPLFQFRTLVLYRDRDELYARIDRRVDRMLGAGLLDEVKNVLAAGYDPSLNALQTIGYREVIAHLSGDCGYDRMRALIQRNTRRYAKRQLTWFRRFPEYDWHPATAAYSALKAALMGPEEV